MDKEKIIQHIEAYVKKRLMKEETGHDWWHTDRVRKTAKIIAHHEGADVFVCELIALLHDAADHKFGYTDDERVHLITEILEENEVNQEITTEVIYVINNMSYKSGQNKHTLKTLHGKIVQDADRLDAIGAVGIARTFAYGGAAGRVMYDPTLDEADDSIDTFSHFYTKLLKLKNGMHTSYARKIAEERHEIMEVFLRDFLNEWNTNNTKNERE